MTRTSSLTLWGFVGGALLAVALLGGGAAAQEKAVEPKAADGKAVSTPSADQDEIMALRRRAAGFWQARIKRDFRAQYEYLEPREKARIAPEEYGHGRGVVQYLAYQVEDAAVGGSFATVQVRVLVRPNHPALVGRRIGPQAVVVQDRWIRVEGTWYRIDKPGPEPPAGGQTPGPGTQ